MKVRIVLSLLTALFMGSLFGAISGCNTMEGLGTDIQRGGKAIKDEAREQKNN